MSLLTFVSCLPRLINENNVRTFHVINFSSFYSLLLFPLLIPRISNISKFACSKRSTFSPGNRVAGVLESQPSPSSVNFSQNISQIQATCRFIFLALLPFEEYYPYYYSPPSSSSSITFEFRAGLPWISRIDIRKRTPIMGKYS